MTFLQVLLWIILPVSLILSGLLIWFMVVMTKFIWKIFLNLPITAEPFKREEGILRYSVNLKTRDGVSIKGFFIPCKNSSGRTIIFCHEIGAGAASFAKYVYFLREKGFNIFTFDFRGHGLSGNANNYVPRQWITSFELRDLEAVFNYLKTNKDVDNNRIGLFGVSKGAGTAIIAASKRKGVKAVVADGAFSTGYTVLDYAKKWIPIFLPVETLPHSLYSFLRFWTVWTVSKKLKCRFPSLEKALKRLNGCALLMIHGEKDSYISVEQSKILYKIAHEPKESWVVPGARHNESVKIAPDEYAGRVSSFFEKYL